jgi:hypothetical protein
MCRHDVVGLWCGTSPLKQLRGFPQMVTTSSDRHPKRAMTERPHRRVPSACVVASWVGTPPAKNLRT